MSTASGAGAAAAAAKRERQEEEEMSAYTPKDLAEDWEFKIVRSNFATFRRPEKLRAFLEEEKRGGWVLVEKFDDKRIRLKRPARAKVTEGDFADGYDPYRTRIGVSDGFIVLTILGAIGIAFALMLLVGITVHG
jgi:hypothetical protein